MRHSAIATLTAAFLGCGALTGLPLYGAQAAEQPSVEISLTEGLKEATDENRLVKIASYNPAMASADVSAAYSRFLPSVNATAGQTWLAYQPGAIVGQNSFFTANRSSFSYGFTATQTLYDFGARSARYQAAKTSEESAKLDLQRIRNFIAFDFISAYFSLLETGKLVNTVEKELDSLNGHVQTARSLYEQGVITKNDLLQANVKMSDTRQRLIAVRNQRSLAVSSLNTILGRPLGTDLKPAEVGYDLTTPYSLRQAWDAAGERRREVAMIANEITVAELEERAKNSGYFPTIFASGGYNYGENKYQLHQDNWSLTLGLNLNLFSGGLTKAEIAKIRHRREQLMEQKRKLLDDIRLEVEQWYRNEVNAKERVTVTKDATEQAEENLRITRVRYQEGVGTATDVLDAISLRTIAETNYFRALYDMRRAHAGLLHAIGDDLASVYK